MSTVMSASIYQMRCMYIIYSLHYLTRWYLSVSATAGGSDLLSVMFIVLMTIVICFAR